MGADRTVSVNYDKISQTYDRFRGIGGPYMESIIALVRESRAQRVVELGAGTGNNSVALLNAHPCELTCIDASIGMLREGRKKCPNAPWVLGNALAVPVQDHSVDFVFSVYMLHHIRDLVPLFRECGRLLKGGCTAHVTTTHDFIDRHPMNRYFPSFAAIDKARFQSLDVIVAAFEKTGFRDVGYRVHRAEPVPIDKAYFKKIENRFISTFEIMGPEEFDSGLARLRADIETHGRLDEPIAWESMAVWASP